MRFETQVYTKLGHMDLDFSLNPVFDPPGSKNVVYVVAEGRDVTEKKKIDRELERKNAELAVWVFSELSSLMCLRNSIASCPKQTNVARSFSPTFHMVFCRLLGL